MNNIPEYDPVNNLNPIRQNIHCPKGLPSYELPNPAALKTSEAPTQLELCMCCRQADKGLVWRRFEVCLCLEQFQGLRFLGLGPFGCYEGA